MGLFKESKKLEKKSLRNITIEMIGLYYDLALFKKLRSIPKKFQLIKLIPTLIIMWKRL